MKLLVCGSRTWTDSGTIAYELALAFGLDRDRVVIHGNCGRLHPNPARGADVIAGLCAGGVGARVEVYPVNEHIDGRWPAAGPHRNARMLRESKPDRGLAFGELWKLAARNAHLARPNGRPWKRTGTGDMVHRMLAVGLPVRWVRAAGAAADLTRDDFGALSNKPTGDR